MPWLRDLIFRKHANSDLAEEIREHIAERTEALIAQGRTPQDAAREARRAFGNPTLARERSVEVWQWRWLENLWADLRFALYQLAKSPGYTLTAILTLAIGIGANAAIFTLIDDVMLRSLPVPHPEQLVQLGFHSPAAQNEGHFLGGTSMRGLDAFAHNATSLSSVSGWSGSMLFVPDDQGTLRSVPGSLITGNAFDVLGVRPYLGRLFAPADDVPGGPEGGWPVILDYGFWLANYHGNPAVIGKHITISAQNAVIIGVLPREFQGIFVGSSQKLYMPMHLRSVLAAGQFQDPYTHPDQIAMNPIGRLKSGASLATLNAELAVQTSAFMKANLPPQMAHAPALRGASLGARSFYRGASFLAEQYGHALFLLQGIVFLVLLLCCVNLGGLQVARIQARQHEFAVRSALGAGRARILQQCLTESLLLALAGSLLAAVVGWSSTAALGHFLTPAGSGEATILRPDARVLAITTVLAILTTLIFGLAPAWIAGRISPGSLLKSQGVQRRSSALRRHLFIPAQFALALTLVLAAGLFSQTLLKLRNGHTGFEPSHIMEVCAQFQSLKKTPAEIAGLYHDMTDFLRNAPGVEAAAYTWVTPLTDFAPDVTVHSLAQAHIEHKIVFNEVGDGYFSTIGTHLLAGREFTETDRDRSVCIVNQAAARLLFPSGSAMDEELNAVASAGHVKDNCRIVGLVEDAHYANLRDPAPPTLYFAAGAPALAEGGYDNNFVFFIRSHTDEEAITAYRATLARFAPTTGYSVFLPLRDQVDQSLGSERLIAILSTTFAAIALLLSGIGVFGLLALRVQERTPEIGVRIAVGATRGHLLRMILTEALRMVAIGSAFGIVLAAIGYTFIRRFLYGASAADLTVALASLAVLILVALLAAAIPARRAAWLDPTQALRAE